MLLGMDLRRFPQIQAELGLVAEYTAHGEPGAGVSHATPARAFHVTPLGDDSADGSAQRPFRTLRRARDAVREMRRSGGIPLGGVAVRLHGGRYPITETLELTEEDSGEPHRPVVWCAHGDDCPVLDGGSVLPALVSPSDPAAIARSPRSARKHVLCCSAKVAGAGALEPMSQYGYYRNPPPPLTDLYQDGELLEPARHPNADWLYVGDPADGTSSNSCFWTSLENLDAWAREPDLAATGFWCWSWADLTTPVTKVDPNAHTLDVRVDVPVSGNAMRLNQVRKGQAYYLLNALCALDRPGEWYLDRASETVYVWPRGTNSARSRLVMSSFSGPFVSLQNVHDLRIEGLVFEYGRGHGVVMKGCRDCRFAGNVVRCFGANGANIHDSENMTIADNVFRVFGHGALELSGGDRKRLVHSGNLVSNNEFSMVGRRRRTYAPHLHLAGVGAEVSFNHFSDSPSSAMRLEGNDFYIVSNLVENVLLESDDQGGVDIYFNASYFGNRYCWNTWRNIGRERDGLHCGQAAIRFDGNISGQTVYGNRFENCGTGDFGAIQSCGGRLHVIDNNLFVDCGRGMSISNYPLDFWIKKIQPTLVKPCLDYVSITNAPYSTRYPGIEDLLWTNQVNHIVRNVTVGATPLLVSPPDATVAYGNFHFPSMPDLVKLARNSMWQPVPEASETGPRTTSLLLRAKRNDGR